MAAVKAAAAHGAETVAADLDVDLGRLQHWVRIVDGGKAPATFVELPALTGVAGMTDADAGPSECTLEFEEPTGRKLRISLRGPATAQALELGRVLWRDSP
jgi:hypothetical protein